MQRYTNIIVGAGSAGCLIAKRLAADTSRRVLFIEAGGSHRYYPWFHVPVGYLFCIGNPRADWMFSTEPCSGIENRSIRYPRGKVLGGCSSINGMIYMRGQSRDYDSWAAIVGDKSWSWDEVLPLFKKHERYYRGETPFHGGSGELFVSKQRVKWDVLDGFMMAAQEVGVPPTDDFNRGNNEGVMYFDVNQRNGWRCSAASAFLDTASSSLKVMTCTAASRVLWKDRTAEVAMGIEVVDKSQEIQRIFLDADDSRSELLICCGAINSPLLLMRSGLGSRVALQNAGMDIYREMPGIGQNLQDHLQIRLVARIRDEWKTLNTESRRIKSKLKIATEFLIHQTGALSMAPSQLGIFTRSGTNERHANIQFHVQPLSLDAFGDPLHSFNAITISVCNLNPESRGYVLPTKSPFENPKLVMNYLSTGRDEQIAIESIKRARQIASAKAFSPYFLSFHVPSERSLDDAAILREARSIATTIFHASGTCKMGNASQDPMAVVDSRLRLIGCRNVRVADCSVMPNIVSGNTNAPVMMIAEKAAHMISVSTV